VNELREKIEELAKRYEGTELYALDDDCGGYIFTKVDSLFDELRKILDEVDARDSLAFIETVDGMRRRPRGKSA